MSHEFLQQTWTIKVSTPSHNAIRVDLWREMAKTKIGRKEDKNQRFYSKIFYFNFYPLHFFLSLLFLHIFFAFLSIGLLFNIYEKYTTAVVTHHRDTQKSLFRATEFNTIHFKDNIHSFVIRLLSLLFLICFHLFC